MVGNLQSRLLLIRPSFANRFIAPLTFPTDKPSEWVLGPGRQCRVDAEIVRWLARYIDGRGADMWSFIQSRLGEEAA